MHFLNSLGRNGALGPVREWKLDDCIAVHKLLETVFIDHDAASSKFCCHSFSWISNCSFFVIALSTCILKSGHQLLHNTRIQKFCISELAVISILTYIAGWKAQCAEYFPYSTHFGGCYSSAVSCSSSCNTKTSPENGSVSFQQPGSGIANSLNGNLHMLQELKI